MKLEDLVACLGEKEIRGTLDVDISQVVCDSRKVLGGALFFCIRGYKVDGHAFLKDAVGRGAQAAVVSEFSKGLSGITQVKVPDVRKAMALLGARYYGNPAGKLSLIGVTGTNGKSTSAILIAELLKRAGMKSGLIGTIYTQIGERIYPSSLTTPDSLDLQKLLSTMVHKKIKYVAMEVSSHSLALDRVYGCHFQVALFTNLTQDHLDFHKTLESYFQAKRKLFEYLKGSGTAVINGDDPWAGRILDHADSSCLTYGLGKDCRIRAEDVETRLDGTSFNLCTPWGNSKIELQLLGLFNVYNSLGAIASALSLGLELSEVSEIIRSIPPIRGRFETINAGQDFTVVVDYAHTPDGIINILKAARALNPHRLIVVFGCGGDRDKTKRPLMGQAAVSLADMAIVTSDNPRSEEPEAIIRDIEEGMTGKDYLVEVDRRKAIQRALSIASKGDIVVIAGKGHENYQIFRDKKIHFDDAETAREFLENREKNGASADH
ncbi:MAG: UDP-N-acetylmuramoyl-L-alanyl-D-glutamate--2,6-diaminopimelate ligase [bacterium]